jgi:hypothetical protein
MRESKRGVPSAYDRESKWAGRRGRKKNFMPQNLFHLTHEASRFFLVSPSTVRRP